MGAGVESRAPSSSRSGGSGVGAGVGVGSSRPLGRDTGSPCGATLAAGWPGLLASPCTGCSVLICDVPFNRSNLDDGGVHPATRAGRACSQAQQILERNPGSARPREARRAGQSQQDAICVTSGFESCFRILLVAPSEGQGQTPTPTPEPPDTYEGLCEEVHLRPGSVKASFLPDSWLRAFWG